MYDFLTSIASCHNMVSVLPAAGKYKLAREALQDVVPLDPSVQVVV